MRAVPLAGAHLIGDGVEEWEAGLGAVIVVLALWSRSSPGSNVLDQTGRLGTFAVRACCTPPQCECWLPTCSVIISDTLPGAGCALKKLVEPSAGLQGRRAGKQTCEMGIDTQH